MENATKALLIAAAVLISILVISLGLVIYNKASEVMDSVDFSSQEITVFNDQFEQYRGDLIRGSEVNALLKTALNANMKSRSEGLSAEGTEHNKFVEVTLDNDTVLEATTSSLGTTKADTSKTYSVEVEYNNVGFAYKIKINVNK